MMLAQLADATAAKMKSELHIASQLTLRLSRTTPSQFVIATPWSKSELA
jgi:hypothetical protein